MRVLIATFIILIFGLLDLLNPIRDGFHKFVSPIQFGLRRSAISTKEYTALFHDLNDIRGTNLRLLAENQELRSIIVDLKRSEEENTVLRKQLELKNSEYFDKDLLLAAVMGNPKDLTGTSIVIDKGARQGIQVGDNVILGNALVGIITELSGERSVVTLVISPQVSMTVTDVAVNSGAEGLAQGDLGTIVEVSRLLPSDVVNVGDVFVTTGKDGKVLPGLSIGSVTKISHTASDPLKTALLEPMVDFTKLDKVFVLLTK